MGVIKKIGVVLLLVLAASTVSHYRRELQRSRRPNVIFILLDAARADHFSCYGYGRNTTPHMDAIAREGALFLNNFSQDTATIGAVTKIFFSRYFTIKALQNDSYRWGIEQENPESLARRYDGQQAFLARVFSSYGYDTVLITDHQFFTEESYFVRQFDRHVFPRGQARSVATYGSCVSEIVSQLRDSPGKKAFIYWHVLCPHEPYRDGAERQEFLSGIDAMTVRAVKEKMRDRDTDSAEAFDSDDDDEGRL